MASLYQLKPAFQRVLRPLANVLARGGISANQVTVAGLVLSLAMGAVLALNPAHQWALLALPPVLLARMALNALDGMLAREHGMRTALGGLLNELCDVASDCALTLPFVLVLPQAAAWVVLLTVLAVLAEFAGVVVQALGGSRRYDGPLGKSDRAFLFGVLALLLGTGVAPGAWCVMVLAAGCALSLLTLFRRIKLGSMEIETASHQSGQSTAPQGHQPSPQGSQPPALSSQPSAQGSQPLAQRAEQ